MDARREPQTPVIIVGAGPVGLSLALGLARQHIRSVVLERDASTSEHSKAPGIHIRTREALRQWGVEDQFRDQGTLLTQATLNRSDAPPLMSLDFGALSADAHEPGLLVLEQGRTEALLREAVEESGWCEVRFKADVTSVNNQIDHVEVKYQTPDGAERLRADYVVGCDGASSTVRQQLVLGFPGQTYSMRPMLADLRIDDERDHLPWPRTHMDAKGMTSALRLREGVWRLIGLHTTPDDEDDVPDDEVRSRMEDVLGPGHMDVVWASRFRIHRRAAPTFRRERVLLAGDAAHVHSPVGGLGMNSGIQDAHNLAWKLAHTLRGGDADRLLDSYDKERQHVVVGRVTRMTDVATRAFLQAPPTLRKGAFAAVRFATCFAAVERQALRSAAMIDLSYPPSAGLPRGRHVGKRLPNPPLDRADSLAHLHDLLPYRPVIVRVGSAPQPPADVRMQTIAVNARVHAAALRALRPLVGGDSGWILVRPDHHIAWVSRGRPRRRELRAAVRRTMGTPSRSAA